MMLRKTALALALSSLLPRNNDAFVPSAFLGSTSSSSSSPSHLHRTRTAPTSSTTSGTIILHSTTETEKSTYAQVDERTGKATGISFLPAETIERATKGSPVEKVKLAKDGTTAFVDVYEYARKIREGEMTWEEVEKADLDSVRCSCCGSPSCVVRV